MCGSTADIKSATAEIRRGKKERRHHRTKIQWPHLLCRMAIIRYWHRRHGVEWAIPILQGPMVDKDESGWFSVVSVTAMNFLWCCLGNRKGIKSIKNLCPLSPKVLFWNNTHAPQTLYGPFSRTTWVNRCQKKTFSALYSAREDNIGRHTDNMAGCHSIPTIQRPTSIIPPFLCWMPFLSQPFQFILAWDRQQICWLSYPVAWFIPSGLLFWNKWQKTEGSWLTNVNLKMAF